MRMSARIRGIGLLAILLSAVAANSCHAYFGMPGWMLFPEPTPEQEAATRLFEAECFFTLGYDDLALTLLERLREESHDPPLIRRASRRISALVQLAEWIQPCQQTSPPNRYRDIRNLPIHEFLYREARRALVPFLDGKRFPSQIRLEEMEVRVSGGSVRYLEIPKGEEERAVWAILELPINPGVSRSRQENTEGSPSFSCCRVTTLHTDLTEPEEPVLDLGLTADAREEQFVKLGVCAETPDPLEKYRPEFCLGDHPLLFGDPSFEHPPPKEDERVWHWGFFK
jgi:hypothetical protein